MVHRLTTETEEFSMKKKDFPPLSGNISSEDSSSLVSWSDDSFHTPEQDDTLGKIPDVKREVHVSSDGTISNVPQSMIKDQYGIVGLLTSIKTLETDPTSTMLTLGIDLTSLGLDLYSPHNFYPSFGSPLVGSPSRLQDNGYRVPTEYVVTHVIRDKLAKIEMSKYGDDVLFFIFYIFVKDVLQVAAAAELFSRGWRYHKEEKVWLIPTEPQGLESSEIKVYEFRTFYFFDANQWTKVIKKFYLDYSKLEDRPIVPKC